MGEYVSDFQAKQDIIEIGRRMYQGGFVAANDGNISIKVADNAIWTTPTGVSKGFMTLEMLVKVDLDGNIIEGRNKPSSEIKMHLKVYKDREDVKAVTHAHPPISTSYAVAGIPLEKPILTEAFVNLGSVPIAQYATPSTYEVPDSIAPYTKDYNAILLANHGVLTWGSDVYQAFFRMETLEYYAKVSLYTKLIGKANELSDDNLDKLIEIRNKMGITGGVLKSIDMDK